MHVFSAAYWSFLLGPVPAMLAARAFGKPVVLHYHSGEADDHLSSWGLRVHPWLRLATRIVVPSAYLRDVFAAPRLPRARDPQRDRTRDLRLSRAPAAPAAPRLRPQPRAVTTRRRRARAPSPALRAERPDATLTVAGQWQPGRAAATAGRTLASDGVQFVGRVEPEHMPALYEDADVILNASVIDNQPVSLLEAIAAGLPVVTTAIGDIPSLVREGETGRLVPPRDPAALARAVTDLLRRPAAAARIAQRARHEVERYTWAHVRPAWMELYGQATGSPMVAA